MVLNPFIRTNIAIKPIKRSFFSIVERVIDKVAKPSTTHTGDNEISHFNQLAPTWWDTNGPQRILHMMNLQRMDFIRNVLLNNLCIPGFNYKDGSSTQIGCSIKKDLENPFKSKINSYAYNVLDIGCGGGILSESLARLPFIKTVYGIDITQECIRIAIEHRDRDPSIVDKISYSSERLQDVKGRYDIVTMFEILEHVDNPSEMLGQAWTRLQPGGILFLSTINRDLISWFTTIFVAENVLRIVPTGTHHLEKYIDAEEIMEWFKENTGCSHSILKSKGNVYIPFLGWVEHNFYGTGNYVMAINKRF